MGEPCAICPSSVFYYDHSESGPTEQERHELFHQPCSTCSLIKFPEAPLCDVCQHLRLRHLVRCVDPEILWGYLLPLQTGLVEDHVNTDCSLCGFINHMIMVGLSVEQVSQIQKASHDVLLYLGPPRDSSSGPSADIYINYADAAGASNVWVGDLHIDNIEKAAVSPVQEMVYWPNLEGKMNECYSTHPECQNDRRSSLPKGFRVIDVTRRCLVEMSNCTFVALSYVWGLNTGTSFLTATKAAIGGMEKENGLPDSGVPRTIEDAIDICNKMGQRYLWVDCLCIIQDDDDDKKNQIEAMNDIYSSALFVLVAVYGNNMDFGILGVGQPRSVVQRGVDIHDLRLTNVLREIEDDPLTVWNTRGWTYQEAVLSKRRLYFTNTRTFFECERFICHEDQFNPETIRDELITSRLIISEDVSRFQSFTRHLRLYTSRKLTYRSDAYKALLGILNSLYKGKDQIISGLPRPDFDRALLWYPDIGRNLITREEIQGTTLPTWSWSSIMGLSDQAQYRATSFYGTFVPWYLINGDLQSGALELFNIHPDSNPDDEWQVYMAIACREGCVEDISFPDFSLSTDNFSNVSKMVDSRWEDYYAFCKEAIQAPLKTTELPQDVQLTHGTKEGVIATRSQTTHLNLIPESTFPMHILDPNGERIGQLCGDATRLREEAKSPNYDSSTKYEFIALSLSGITPRPYSSEELAPKNYVDVDGNSLEKVPVVNVLMITRRGKGGVARRRELGWVYLVDWVRLRREWEVVVLE